MTNFQNTSPSGQTITGSTDMDLSNAVVIWAWSNSCNDWLRQSDAVNYDIAARQVRALQAQCPEIRPAFTRCVAV